MRTAYIDTETMGLYGPVAILQYAFDDDDPTLYNPWLEPAGKTRALIREITECRVLAHNLTFDWQKIHNFYAGLDSFADHERPIDDIERFVQSEYDNRSKVCLKPPAAVCTLLLCQKELGGTALAAKEVRIRQVPEQAAELLCGTLNHFTDLPPILFAKRKEGGWHVAESDRGPGWNDVVLKFAPSNGLKPVARLVLGVEETQTIGAEVLPPKMPDELGYIPYVKVLRESPVSEGMTLWPELLRDHIDFWNTNEKAVKYALDDIILLRKLDEHLGKRDSDFDGELACQVASCRMAGFQIDHYDALSRAAEASEAVIRDAQINVDAHAKVREWIGEAFDDFEREIILEGCNKKTLKKIVSEMNVTEREQCCDDGCPRCGGAGWLDPGPMPVAERAAHVLKVRKHKKRKQLFDKLAVAQGAYPSFRVIGTKSGRMSGADGLNYHGIDGSRDIREIFTLAQDGEIVCGGDMNSQELAIAAAVMNDDNLARDIETGRSLHGEFASTILNCSYEQIMANKEDKSSPEGQAYAKAKICIYAMLYGAASYNISMTLGCSEAEAQSKMDRFFEKYPHMKSTRKFVTASLQCLSSDGGKIHVTRPDQDSVKSLFGYTRSFEIEMSVIRTIVDAMEYIRSAVQRAGQLYDLSDEFSMDKLPSEVYAFLKLKQSKVIRKKDKEQTVLGACLSALYGGAFSLQGKIQRAALNHLIQSAGRTCTLRVQKRIWDDVQPVGVYEFRVKLMSVHDEIVTVSKPEYAKPIEQAVYAEMHALTDQVPLLSLDWATDVGSWYGVKAAEEGLRCGWTEDDEEEFEQMMEAESPGTFDLENIYD